MSFIMLANCFANELNQRGSFGDSRVKSPFALENAICAYLSMFCALEYFLRIDTIDAHDKSTGELFKSLLGNKSSEMAQYFNELELLRDSIVHGWIYQEEFELVRPTKALKINGELLRARKGKDASDQKGVLKLDYLPSTFGVMNVIKLLLITDFILQKTGRSWANIVIAIPKEATPLNEEFIQSTELVDFIINNLARYFNKDNKYIKKQIRCIDRATKEFMNKKFSSKLLNEIACPECHSLALLKETKRSSKTYTCLSCDFKMQLH